MPREFASRQPKTGDSLADLAAEQYANMKSGTRTDLGSKETRSVSIPEAAACPSQSAPPAARDIWRPADPRFAEMRAAWEARGWLALASIDDIRTRGQLGRNLPETLVHDRVVGMFRELCAAAERPGGFEARQVLESAQRRLGENFTVIFDVAERGVTLRQLGEREGFRDRAVATAAGVGLLRSALRALTDFFELAAEYW